MDDVNTTSLQPRLVLLHWWPRPQERNSWKWPKSTQSLSTPSFLDRHTTILGRPSGVKICRAQNHQRRHKVPPRHCSNRPRNGEKLGGRHYQTTRREQVRNPEEETSLAIHTQQVRTGSSTSQHERYYARFWRCKTFQRHKQHASIVGWRGTQFSFNFSSSSYL